MRCLTGCAARRGASRARAVRRVALTVRAAAPSPRRPGLDEVASQPVSGCGAGERGEATALSRGRAASPQTEEPTAAERMVQPPGGRALLGLLRVAQSWAMPSLLSSPVLALVVLATCFSVALGAVVDDVARVAQIGALLGPPFDHPDLPYRLQAVWAVMRFFGFYFFLLNIFFLSWYLSDTPFCLPQWCV